MGKENYFAMAWLMQTTENKKLYIWKIKGKRSIQSLIPEQPNYLLFFVFQQVRFLLPTARLHMIHRLNQRFSLTTPHFKPRGTTLLMWNHQSFGSWDAHKLIWSYCRHQEKVRHWRGSAARWKLRQQILLLLGRFEVNRVCSKPLRCVRIFMSFLS